jgi:GDP-L-fucose synthase
VTNADFYRGKKVLVAGAAGFVGTHLVNKLSALGADVRGSLYKKAPQRNLPSVEYMRLDLTQKQDCIKAVKGVDYVFMAAANSSGAAVMDKTPLAHLTPNLIMNALMLEASYEQGVKKFCFISSNTVYPLTDFAVTEQDVNFDYFEKYFIVGWMKRFSEIMCEMYAKKIRVPMACVIIRPGNLYGPYDKFTWAESKVVASLIRRSVERHDPFEVWGDGQDIKDFLYIDDFIEGLVLVFEGSNSFETFNLASGQPVTIEQILNKILRVSDYEDANVVFNKSMPTMIPKRLIDVGLVKSRFNWEPTVSLLNGLQRTVNWYASEFKDKAPESLLL